MSDDEWKFATVDNHDNIFYIENIAKRKVLGALDNGKVILEDQRGFVGRKL